MTIREDIDDANNLDASLRTLRRTRLYILADGLAHLERTDNPFTQIMCCNLESRCAGGSYVPTYFTPLLAAP